MPQLSAASSRDRPSKTSAIASIRRAALASRVRAAARRKSPADRSRRVIATAMSASAPGQWRSESRRRPKRGHVRVIGQGAWYQMFEAGVRQFAEWGDAAQGRHILIAVARYLAAHAPTERSALQTAEIARRLMRGAP